MISLTRTSSQWRALAVLAGLLTVMATDVASAHGRYDQTRRSHGVAVSRQCGTPVRSPARRQYWRGYTAARQPGYAAGFEAGSCNGRYDPTPIGCGQRRSRSYRNGYAAGYAEAYAQGYRLAQQKQRHTRRGWHRWHDRGRW